MRAVAPARSGTGRHKICIVDGTSHKTSAFDARHAARILPPPYIACRPTITGFLTHSCPITAQFVRVGESCELMPMGPPPGTSQARLASSQWPPGRAMTVTATALSQTLERAGRIGARVRGPGGIPCHRSDNPAGLSILTRLASRGGPGTVRGVKCSRPTLRIPTTFIES